jgi:hypothetical protein
MEYLGARGTLIHEKKLEVENLWQTPFKKDGEFQSPDFWMMCIYLSLRIGWLTGLLCEADLLAVF